MSLAIMASQRCEVCCESQMRSAINHGATKEEIMETMNVIFITSGAPGVAVAGEPLKSWKEMKNKVVMAAVMAAWAEEEGNKQ